MYSIGEFSKITGLTVKTLRFYDEQGVLKPTCVDEQTGYRYYDARRIELARVIRRLRELEFSLAEIAQMLTSYADEGDILEFLERQRQSVESQARHYDEVRSSLDHIISKEREARTLMQTSAFEVAETTVDTMLIAGVRMRGRYSECGAGFAQIGRQLGRYICGAPLLLCYDNEYKDEDADFETCMPVRQPAAKVNANDSIFVRELSGGRCVTLVHKGPYDELGRSYAKIFEYVRDKGYKIDSPCREVYLKGPGMIFKGNPKKYLTEIQLPIRE
jgi:DNA-binding transcriptional MerR regulator/effector-binding domain-containing protein